MVCFSTESILAIQHLLVGNNTLKKKVLKLICCCQLVVYKHNIKETGKALQRNTFFCIAARTFMHILISIETYITQVGTGELEMCWSVLVSPDINSYISL